MDNNKNWPLVLVFYMDRALLASELMGKIAMSINDAIAEREANAMAFFVPTDGKERIEQISYVSNEVVDMDNINKLVNDIKDSFTIK